MPPLTHHIRRHAKTVRRHFWNAFIPHEGNDHRPHALRHKALTAYAIAIITVKVIVGGAAIIYPGPSATSDLTQNQIVHLTNNARKASGLKVLISNPALAAGAQLKANDMIAKSYFAHISPSNITPWYWFKKAGYHYSSAGENLAIDFTTAEDVIDAWLASPGHRKNIMNSKYRDIGVAVMSGKMNGVSSTVIVQFFGVATQPKQQVKPVPKVAPAKPQPSTKPSTVAQTSPPAPIPVLGEETAEVKQDPPVAPKITSPTSGVVLSTALPWISGESQANLTIAVYSSGKKIAETASDAHGYFTIQPAASLPDGIHAFSAVALSGVVASTASDPVRVTVDTQPPSSFLASATVLPSYVHPGSLTVNGTLTGKDIAEATAIIGSARVTIPASGGAFFAEVKPSVVDDRDSVMIELKDAVGNVSVVTVASMSFLDVQVLRPSSREGFGAWIPRIIFFSRQFFITFWLFLFIALSINVIIKVRVQHRPVILYSLLLLYGLTIILITS